MIGMSLFIKKTVFYWKPSLNMSSNLMKTKFFVNFQLKYSQNPRSRKYSKCRNMYSIDPVNPLDFSFNKLLIANRGEIACRIINTAKSMGIKTVAVYSVTDAQAHHIKLADEIVFIGDSPASESYLNKSKIMEAVKLTNADAVHPGYGFLSENAEFVEMLENEQVTFIGPSSASIKQMGDKLESKRQAKLAGVTIIPGYDGIVEDAEQCVDIARNIGYPVMIKASAGGGGKGMRIARTDSETRDGFKLSTQEAISSFGDKRILIEKFIENPRHIEIQILGDKFGNVIYLNERECSIQRRNQKVIEEAPSIFLDNKTREAMGQQAVSLCKNLGYFSAGTIEFLVDENKNFYFLEMNTRLQVEHPVTECITGIDLVQQMIKIAKGHKLNIKQEDIKINGWAIESRVYAEDPYKFFGLPCTGRLYKYIEPQDFPNIRCDSGIEEGSEINIYYDPIISKLISHGKNREEAIQRHLIALDSYVIRGITHNIPLLRDILSQKNFCMGNISTNFLYENYSDGFNGTILNESELHKLIATGSVLYVTNFIRNMNRTAIKKNKENNLRLLKIYVKINNRKFTFDVDNKREEFIVTIDKKEYKIDKSSINLTKPVLKAIINNEENIMQLISRRKSDYYDIMYKGTIYQLHIMEQRVADYLHLMPVKSKRDISKKVISPMPGLVKSVNHKVGDYVIEGEELCVIEAMKMQNSIVAGTTGVIKSINIAVQDTVNNGDVLIEIN